MCWDVDQFQLASTWGDRSETDVVDHYCGTTNRQGQCLRLCNEDHAAGGLHEYHQPFQLGWSTEAKPRKSLWLCVDKLAGMDNPLLSSARQTQLSTVFTTSIRLYNLAGVVV